VQDNIQPEAPGGLANAAHPFACVFTFIFKATAFFMYNLINKATLS
jgi:hypothetical protein